MTIEQKFIQYVLVWCLVALVSDLIGRRVRTARNRKRVSLISGLSVIALMSGFLIWMEFPLRALGILFALALIILYAGQRYTYYCETCGHVQQQMFLKVEFCPKCGVRVESNKI